METISFKNVSFSYPGCEKKALDNITLSLGNSDFIVLCGKSGCGKSTLLRQIKKNFIPYGVFEGSVQYMGTEITELDNYTSTTKIGFVQQNPDNQIVTDKVWHELAFGLESLGLKNEVIRQRVAEMANFFGIQTWFRKSVHELSGGQKQLLNLASVMAMQPDVLILDEPTSQLDPLAASEFLRIVQRINKELGTMIIISEHRLEEVFPMADKVILMDDSRVSIYDETKEVAKYLADKNNPHDMYYGLPSVMRIFGEVDNRGECPLTIREGRLWLDRFMERHDQLPLDNQFPEKKSAVKNRIFNKDKENYAIEMEDVWFRYSKQGDDVLRGVNLKVKKGEWFCLMGGNGTGKSTTLKAISKNINPYKGSIKVNGTDIKKEKTKELFNHKLSMLPQNPQAIFTEITVEEELYEALYDEKISREMKLSQIDEMLNALQLSHLRKYHPYDLSGGEQQRLALGKILLLKPTILLLDEPTKGLDPFFKRILANIFTDLKDKGVTILMVSHDIEFCAEYADRCALFFDGGAISTAPTKDFFSGNSFYTTASNRISRKWFKDAITCEEVVKLCQDLLT